MVLGIDEPMKSLTGARHQQGEPTGRSGGAAGDGVQDSVIGRGAAGHDKHTFHDSGTSGGRHRFHLGAGPISLTSSYMYSSLGVQGEVDDRYEPLPGMLQLPGYVWRRLGRPAKIGIVVAAVAAVVAAILAAPSIQRSNEEHSRAEAEKSARIERQQIELTRRQQRPRFARSAAAGQDLGVRTQ